MTNQLSLSSVTDFSKMLKHFSPKRDYINLFKQPIRAELFYRELGWYKMDDYFPKIFDRIVRGFLKHYESEIECYLNQTKTLNHICLHLIDYLKINQIALDKTAVLDFVCSQFGIYIDNSVSHIINNMQERAHWNIFGYGLSHGDYEIKWKQYLLDMGLAKTVTIFGLDPYCKMVNPEVNMLTSAELLAMPELKFDLVFSRWVLHHVTEEERWHTFSNVLRHVSDRGRVIIIEEGCFPNDSLTLEEKIFELMLGLVDVIVNAGLRSDWLKKNDKQQSADFFIKHLTRRDMHELKQQLPSLSLSNWQTLGSLLLKQHIIDFDVRYADVDSRQIQQPAFLLRV